MNIELLKTSDKEQEAWELGCKAFHKPTTNPYLITDPCFVAFNQGVKDENDSSNYWESHGEWVAEGGLLE